jgi:hypothetical protein
VPEEGVEVGKQGIPLADGSADATGGRLAKQPRLAALGLKVGVATEEGVEGANLKRK